jgi:UPF0755 protein
MKHLSVFSFKNKLTLIVLLMGAGLGVLGISYGVFFWCGKKLTFEAEKKIRIKKGQSFQKIAKEMERHQIISSAFLFRLGAFGQSQHIKAGLFKFSGTWTHKKLLDELIKGQQHFIKVRLPEGFNIWQMATHLHDVFELSEKEWLTRLQAPPPFPQGQWSESVPNWEGFLTPETYVIDEEASADDFLTLVLKQFLIKHIELEHLKDLTSLNDYETLILASIIEKETSMDSEKPLVSSVFHNRLEKGMKLQADPTVIYGAWHKIFDRIRKEHLETPTPYNTYTNRGLPPTPICSPSQTSLAAAMSPPSTPYLYFVADGKGGHKFSENLKTHAQAVKDYLKLSSK